MDHKHELCWFSLICCNVCNEAYNTSLVVYCKLKIIILFYSKKGNIQWVNFYYTILYPLIHNVVTENYSKHTLKLVCTSYLFTIIWLKYNLYI